MVSTLHPAAAIDNFNPSQDLRKTAISPDYWYPIARTHELKTNRPLGRSFAGEPVVLVRTASGSLFALEDRCAHRQVPLHAGVVDGEHLQCCYHCWTYDASGQCVNVPYLDKAKSLPNGVRAYPCREAYGLIFIYPGDRTQPGFNHFPDIPTHASNAYKTRYLDRRVECHYSFMHENLMDMNHQFLHRRLMGHIRAIPLDMRRGENSVEVDYTFKRTRGKQHIGERFILNRDGQMQENSREQDIMTICTAYPYQTLKFWTAGSNKPALDLWNVYIPLDRDQRSNHTYGLMMIKKPAIPGLIHLLWPFIIWFTEGIFAEDRWIVEEEQKAFDRQGADWNQEVFPIIRNLREVLLEGGIPLHGSGI